MGIWTVSTFYLSQITLGYLRGLKRGKTLRILVQAFLDGAMRCSPGSLHSIFLFQQVDFLFFPFSFAFCLCKSSFTAVCTSCWLLPRVCCIFSLSRKSRTESQNTFPCQWWDADKGLVLLQELLPFLSTLLPLCPSEPLPRLSRDHKHVWDSFFFTSPLSGNGEPGVHPNDIIYCLSLAPTATFQVLL